MRKLIVSGVLLFGLISSAKSQELQQGNIPISIGVGAPNIAKSVLKAAGDMFDFKVTGSTPIHFRAEYMISPYFGAGISINRATANLNFQINGLKYELLDSTYNVNVKFNSTSIMPRINVHFLKENRVDPYFGIALGYQHSVLSFAANTPIGLKKIKIPGVIPVGFEASAGVRYFLNDYVGLYGELGITKSLVNGGVVVKF